MRFTYKAYKELIEKLMDYGYHFTDYHSWDQYEKCVIIRHDIDYSIEKAVKMAAFEKEMGGVSAVYFVLLTSDFYNLFSKESADALKRIVECGHKIGLHFDEARYPELADDLDGISRQVIEESVLLGKAAGQNIDSVSMHRPGKAILGADLDIPGIINSYGQTFFKGFKYLSDSRKRWKEPADAVIESGKYNKLHILIHPFWYDDDEIDIHESVAAFVNRGSRDRYVSLSTNITDLISIMPKEEVKGWAVLN